MLAVVAIGCGVIAARACMPAAAPTPVAARAVPPVAPVALVALVAPRQPAVAASDVAAAVPLEPVVDAFGDAAGDVPLAPLPRKKRIEPMERAAVVPAERSAAVVAPTVMPASSDAGVVVAPVAAPLVEKVGASSLPLSIAYRDELSWLKLVELRVFIDDKRVLDEKQPQAKRERTLLQTRVSAGEHQVLVEAAYVGESGIFGYMDAYRIKLRQMVTVDAAKDARVLAHAFDRGALQAWEKRPALKLSVQ